MTDKAMTMGGTPSDLQGASVDFLMNCYKDLSSKILDINAVRYEVALELNKHGIKTSALETTCRGGSS